MNEKLLEETIHLIEKWKVTSDRLEKVGEHKKDVSEAVYEKVKRDYETKMHQLTDEVRSKKSQVDRELHVMEEASKKALAQLEMERHAMEELDLRNKLGEFGEDEYRQSSADLHKKIDKLSEVVASIEEGIERYRSLFENIDFDHPTAAKSAKVSAEVEEEVVEELAKEEEISEKKKIEPKAAEESAAATKIDIHEEHEEVEAVFEKTMPAVREEHKEEFPAAQPPARLVVVSGKDAGAVYPLEGTISIGRGEKCDVKVLDPRVSRQHAKIQQHGEEYILIDLHSSNGSYVNGQKIDEYVLSPGDEVQIGETVFEFQV